MKNKFSAIFVICIAIFIGCAGMFLMEIKLQYNEEKMLSGKKSIVVKDIEEIENKSPESNIKLTETEMVAVVSSIEGGKDVKPHEPKNGQLTMEQAVEKGKEWIDKLFTEYIGADFMKNCEYTKINATLCVNKIEHKEISKALYSYWTVELEKQDVIIKLIINGVSGQVLNTMIYSFTPKLGFGNIKKKEIVDAYIKFLNLKVDNKYVPNNNSLDTFFNKIDGGNLYAVINIGSISITNIDGTKKEENSGEYNSIILYMTTNVTDK